MIRKSDGMFRISAWLIIAVLCVTVCLAEVIICPKCGYECKEGDVKCSHCGQVLPGAADSNPEPDGDQIEDLTPDQGDKESDQDSNFLNPKHVMEEFKLGIKYFNKDTKDDPLAEEWAPFHTELSYLFFKNASALIQLTDPSKDSGELHEKLMQYIKKCEGVTKYGLSICPVCQGTGNKIIKSINLSSEEEGTYRAVPGTKCEKCRGTGYLKVIAPLSEIQRRIGRAMNFYRMKQQGRRHVSVGDAWVPWEIAEKLTVRQKAAVKRTAATACKSCFGTGRIACTKCSGLGEIKCDACVNGRVPVKVEDNRLGGNQTEMCQKCMGKGTIPCETCSGTGGVICSACDGSGQPPLCTKCDGSGIVTCRKCKGSGVYRGEECIECMGEGIVLCSSCLGSGRKK